jgi:ribonuclease P protein component
MPRSPARQLSLPRSARLLRRRDFLLLKERGAAFAEGPLAASWLPRTAEPTRAGMAPAVARVGIAVSSKVGDAVRRNRVKRRLREAVRHELQRLPAVDLVLVARASALRATVAELRAWIRRASRRMQAPEGGAA